MFPLKKNISTCAYAINGSWETIKVRPADGTARDSPGATTTQTIAPIEATAKTITLTGKASYRNARTQPMTRRGIQT